MFVHMSFLETIQFQSQDSLSKSTTTAVTAVSGKSNRAVRRSILRKRASHANNFDSNPPCS